MIARGFRVTDVMGLELILIPAGKRIIVITPIGAWCVQARASGSTATYAVITLLTRTQTKWTQR